MHNWGSSEDAEEEAPMRHSFSVEDLLDEVEKICYDASGTSKVSHNYLCMLVGQKNKTNDLCQLLTCNQF